MNPSDRTRLIERLHQRHEDYFGLFERDIASFLDEEDIRIGEEKQESYEIGYNRGFEDGKEKVSK